jgi:hypothetical protein
MGGYSARYHAASLAAVFLALAIGILIGVGFGDDVVSGTTEELEQSLREDVQEARRLADERSRALDREHEFGDAAYPALVRGDLRDRDVALIALGSLDPGLADDVEAAIEPAGASLVEVAVVREPPDLDALAADLRGTRHRRVKRDPEALERFGRAAGRQLVLGGGLVRKVRDQLLSRFSGRASGADDIVVTRGTPKEVGKRAADATSDLELGLLDGIQSAGRPTVAVERTDAEESAVELFESHEISTVDDLDLIAGQVAMVAVLLGADGSFGAKETADGLLPDLLHPSAKDR